MYANKLSVSLPNPLIHFVDEYQASHACKSRSEVIQEALKLLRQKELEHAYHAASAEVDSLFEATTLDGLDDETW
jgi:antitoxin ParD1/3/4